MKKSLLAFLFAVALVVPALAENMWVGGYFSYDDDSPKNGDSTSSFFIQPEFGYNLNEKFDIGIDLFYAKDEDGTDTETRFGIEPFVRYKIFEIGDFDFLVKGRIYYDNGKYDKSDVTINSYGIVVSPIISYSINETWSISASLDFASFWFEQSKCDEDSSKESTECYFNANKGSLASIGFSYHF